MKIPGYIEVKEDNGMAMATVRFPSLDFEFFVACRSEEDLKRALQGMLADHEQVRGIMRRTGCLDWEAMERACRGGATVTAADIKRGANLLGADLLEMLAKVQEPPDARDDLVRGRRLVCELIKDPWLPADVKRQCVEWASLVDDMLRGL